MALSNFGLGFLISAKDQASAVFNKVRGAMGGLSGQGAQMTQNLDQAWQRIKSVGTAMQAWGSGGVAFLGTAATEANRVNKSMREVASIADKTAFPMSTIKQISMDMALTYGGDLKTHANALYASISAGASSAAEATAVLTAANKFAVGGLTDVDTASRAILGTLNAYTMKFSDAGTVADKFTIAIKLGQTRAEEFAPILGQLAPSAHAAGVSLDEMMASIAVLTVSGLQTTASITGMKMAISNIQKPTADAASEAKRLGIEFNAGALRGKGLAGVLDSVTKSGKYNADSFIKLFGSIEAVNAMQILAAGDGAKFKNAINEMGKSAGAADAAFQTIGVSATELLASAKQVATVIVGDIVAPMFKAFANGVRYLVNAFVSLPKVIQQVIVWGTALGSMFLLAAGAAIALVASVGAFIAAFAAIGWEVLMLAAAEVVTIITTLGSAFAAAGAVVYAFWQAVQKDLGGIGTYLTSVFGQAGNAFSVLQAMFTSGGHLTGKAAEQYLGLGEGVQNAIQSIWQFWENLKAFAAGVSAGFDTALSSMGPAFSSLVQSLQMLGAALGFSASSTESTSTSYDTFAAAGRRLGDGLGAVFGFLVQVLQIVIDVAEGVVEGFYSMGPVFSTVGGAVGLIIDSFGELIGAFESADVAGAKNRSGWQSLGVTIGVVAGAIGYVIAAIAFVISAAVGVIGSAVSGIIGIFSGLVTGISGIFEFLSGLFEGDWPKMWMGLAKVVYGVVSIIVSIVAAMVSAIASLIDSVGKAFGKDLGIKAAVEGGKKDMLKDLSGVLRLPQETTPTNAAPEGAPKPKSVNQPPVGASYSGSFSPQTAPWQGPTMPSPALAMMGAGGGGGNIDALAAKINAPRPISVTSNIKLDVDGQTLADVVDKYSSAGNNRSFGPGETSKG